MNSLWIEQKSLASVLPRFLPPQASHFPLNALYPSPSHELLPSDWKQISLPLQTSHSTKKNRENITNQQFSRNSFFAFLSIDFWESPSTCFVYRLPDPWINPFLCPNKHFFPIFICRGIKINVRTVLCCYTHLFLLPSVQPGFSFSKPPLISCLEQGAESYVQDQQDWEFLSCSYPGEC